MQYKKWKFLLVENQHWVLTEKLLRIIPIVFSNLFLEIWSKKENCVLKSNKKMNNFKPSITIAVPLVRYSYNRKRPFKHQLPPTLCNFKLSTHFRYFRVFFFLLKSSRHFQLLNFILPYLEEVIIFSITL